METGFRKPLLYLTVDDKPAISNTLKNHHGIVKVKAEVDQFCEGLVTLGVLDCIKRFPDVMRPLFVDTNPIQITKGKCTQLGNTVCVITVFHFKFSEYFKKLLVPDFAATGSPQRGVEEATYLNFLYFVEECEGE